MEKRILTLCLLVAVVGFIVLLTTAEAKEDSHSPRGVRASLDKSKHANGTAIHGKGGKGTTPKPHSATIRSKTTTKRFGNRPRAPITGKPVDTTSKPKPKPLSPLLAPRNPKHTTTTSTTLKPDDDEYEDEEEEDK